MTNDQTPNGVQVAYFITSYRSPEQLCRLVATIRRGQPMASIVLHHDASKGQLDASLFEDMTNVHLIESRHPIKWGDMSLELARWRVFRWILENLDVDWVMLMSEQDYPIIPLKTFETRLAETQADAVMSRVAMDSIEDRSLRRDVQSRYLYQYRSLPALRMGHLLPKTLRDVLARFRWLLFGAVNRLVPPIYIRSAPLELNLPSSIGFRSSNSPFSTDFPCWFHDAWYVLSRRAVEHVIDFVDAHPDVIAYYSKTFIPVESATGTIVSNDPDLTVESATVTATIWSNPKSGRPDTIARETLEPLRRTGAAFARKFEHSDAGVLNSIDETLFQSSRDIS